MFTRLAAMLVFAVLFSGCFVRGGYYYRRPGYYPGYRAPGYGPGFRRPGYRPGRGPVIVVPPRGGRRPGRGGRPGGVIIVPKSAAITLPSTGFSALALNGATFSGAVIEHAVDPSMTAGTVRFEAEMRGESEAAVDQFLDRIESRDSGVFSLGLGSVTLQGVDNVEVDAITVITPAEDSALPAVTIDGEAV
jgi:hypothetical protein